MFAIIGPTASGKSDLAIKLALKLNYEILSLDSLSIYKEIDIASAKPSKEELSKVKHYGVNEIYPNEKFDVMKFIEIYKKIPHKNIIIVGGTGFYLKAMLEGISQMPEITDEIKKKAKQKDYAFFESVDPDFASKISPNDTYRIQKGLEIYFATKTPPSVYFKNNPPKPVLPDIPIFEIAVDRSVLRERIKKRTDKMFNSGLIDEVAYLEKKYRDRRLPALKAIGIKEVLDYFNGKYTLKTLKEKIITNTARLAKRQQTFNKTQFKKKISAPLEELEEIILSEIK
ncbi:tRNA delta(2)-isopentenylpyrophosphate transferase [Nautilia profundicola AmH]|uniref:tRNA dimethylallyltransferase n=1 Tax=Nautilia profundicola (strain ATCC BAA-1463 / DSM 18972 / AmH) TaxID=598659 RepID=MIAA_NAUPA|nr:tRNA (adenosine(37)-N6)-dimethylallyltransferase MiaA [Nautilia profundicola]B9L615.1 RecName: Full=tRNA dimethylallyltransferase; AltName: Full=Dimethylallyl diphosphate:tRNA dimethylallyltransferase; Short=DMAPP:tRNA dimethylallyltransferase; Short=DMATase; AltName: Full=Isopentenyl-diphosphate:tRNA isopentenyltransferase; Short=IPP transferase; Short=IPPT; Short=IPTase [Nautilia profundicola AmH]ACM92621.1 tRNA delta(2)-isopentenylpyrophosphate transferase [Nautilia profundicola AmH]